MGDMISQLLWQIAVPACITLLATVLTALGTWAARKLVNTIESKANIEISAEKEALIERIVFRGVQSIEEFARDAVKNQQEKATGNQKFSNAFNKVVAELNDLGIKVPADAVTDRIHAALDTLRRTDNGGDGNSLGESD